MSIYRGAGGSGDATNDATVSQVQTYASQAATSATNAAASATAAAASESGAATSATLATSAKNDSVAISNTVAGYVAGALASETAAAGSATAAAASATAAALSEGGASGSASDAADSAATATNQATAASTSATNSANSAASALAIYGNTTAMNTAVTNASNSATSAATSATNASTSASNASSSATSAATSATSAATSATNASNATANALNIYGSIAAVQDAATNSTANKNAAAASASAASASASAASTSATASAGSASAAATSAAAASAVALGNEPVRHSVRPSLLLDFANTKQLDPRITFTRASTATFYDGKTTAKAEENLYLYSQDFVTGGNWNPASVSITANTTTAPDGTSTGSLMYPSSTGTFRVIRQDGLTGQSVSIYAKAQNKSWIALGFGASFSTFTWFDLTNGVVGSTAATVSSATITSVGNGWYRCSIVYTNPQTTNRYMIADGSGNTNITANGTDGIFIWGAQLEQRSAVTAYTPTTTAAITNYIPALQTAASGVARFDHNPTTGESLGLLIEEQRVNLLTYSEQIDNGAWSKSNCTVTANQVVAPDGLLTSDFATTSAANSGLFKIETIAANAATYTASIYVKYLSGSTSFRFRLALTGGTAVAKFVRINAQTGAFLSSDGTYSITSVGNGWYRVSLEITNNSTNTTFNFQAFLTDDTTSTNSIAVWGAQVEAGAFATSYIPTVASQVTRPADAASLTGTNFSSWYRGDEGTMFVDFVRNTGTSTVGSYVSEIRGSTATQSFRFRTGSDIRGQYVTPDGTVQCDLSLGAITSDSNIKAAFTIKTNNFTGIKNSGTLATDTTGLINATHILLDFSSSGLSNNSIKKFAYYPKQLTSAEITGLTTV
jgi:hypothetical protein